MFNPQSLGFNRRDMLRLAATGAFAGTISWLDIVAKQAMAQENSQRKRKFKSCIVLFMSGGPSQAHTFDLKPGGHYKPIKTTVPGIEVSEYLPKVAQQMKHLALVRGMSTGDNNHGTAHYLMRTGFRKGTGGILYPHFGSIACSELVRKDNRMPNFIAIRPGSGSQTGFTSGHLDAQWAPMVMYDVTKGIANLKPKTELDQFDRRTALMLERDQSFIQDYQSDAAKSKLASYKKAIDLVHYEKVAEAFQVEKEPESVRKKYGDSKFARQCLGARRLVEYGVPFVEVMHPNYWDTHGGAEKGQKAYSEVLDQPMAALLEDLHERGMLEDTLVVWMGEFGRNFSGNNHHAKAWTTAFAGAGVQGGQVVGKTDKKAMTVEDRPVKVSDFVATVLKALDVDYKKEYDVNGRPVGMVDKDPQPVDELFS